MRTQQCLRTVYVQPTSVARSARTAQPLNVSTVELVEKQIHSPRDIAVIALMGSLDLSVKSINAKTSVKTTAYAASLQTPVQRAVVRTASVDPIVRPIFVRTFNAKTVDRAEKTQTTGRRVSAQATGQENFVIRHLHVSTMTVESAVNLHPSTSVCKFFNALKYLKKLN